MKIRFIAAMLLVLCISGPGFAGQFGPLAPLVKSGEISQEIGYFRSVGEWEVDESGFEDGKVTMNQAYLQAGYALARNWEGYFRLGGSDLNLENAHALDDSDMKDSIAPFVSIGTRGLLYDGKVFDLGLFFQGSYYAPFEDSKTVSVAGTRFKEELRLENMWDVNLGLAVQANMGRVSVYAGPFAYYGGGRLETEAEVAGVEDSSDATYEEKGNVGGVAGINVQLARNINFYVEGQYKSELSAGGAVTYLRIRY